MINILIGICNSSGAKPELLGRNLKVEESTYMINVEIHTYSTGRDLLNNYRPVYDILFLTLPMPDIDANLFVSELRKLDSFVRIVTISESYELFRPDHECNVVNCSGKPPRYFQIRNELKNYILDGHILLRPSLWISNQQGEFKLYLHKIRYIETYKRQLKFHYGNEVLFHNGTLSDFENKPSDCGFFRCNNSYIVNINYIERIAKDISRYGIYLITGEMIPLSRNKKRDLLEMLGAPDQ